MTDRAGKDAGAHGLELPGGGGPGRA
jgi:hypothetical protein